MRSGFRGLLIGLWTIAATSLIAAGALAADDPQVKVGKAQYMKYCSSCHGPTGTGQDGAASRTFAKPPTNLTTLAKENGGKFPMMEVLNVVKGDQPIAAHGTRDMPVWGQVLGRPLEDGMYGQDKADADLMNIGKYLESIQVK